MGMIVKRKKKNGAVMYTAQIRINRNGIIHSESKSSADKKFLQHWLVVRDNALRQDGALEALKSQGTTLGDVLAWYLEDFDGLTKFGRSKLSTVLALQKIPALASLNATDLKPADLIRFANDRRGAGAGPATVNGDFIWLRNAMRSARLARGVEVNVQAVDDAARLLRSERVIGSSKKRNRRPTLDELDALLSYFERSDQGRKSKIKMRDIVMFALFSGRRQEEICTIRWEDVDERRQGVLVKDMKHPREKIDTFCHLTDEAWRVLQSLPKKEAGIIFDYISRSVGNRFYKACKVLNIEDLHFHDLRHECVSWLFELGWEIPRVSGVSGHKSWSSLQRYTHLREHKAHNKYEGWRWLTLFD